MPEHPLAFAQKKLDVAIAGPALRQPCQPHPGRGELPRPELRAARDRSSRSRRASTARTAIQAASASPTATDKIISRRRIAQFRFERKRRASGRLRDPTGPRLS